MNNKPNNKQKGLTKNQAQTGLAPLLETICVSYPALIFKLALSTFERITGPNTAIAFYICDMNYSDSLVID